MTLRPEYSLGHSDLNPFLFATTGQDKAGQELTILSILARLELDPWAEAGRLAKLPKDAAVKGVAALLCQGNWKMPEANGVAARLVELLPRHAVSPGPPPATPTLQSASTAKMKSRPSVWLLCLAAAVAWYLLLSYMKADTALEPSPGIVTTQ